MQKLSLQEFRSVTSDPAAFGEGEGGFGFNKL